MYTENAHHGAEVMRGVLKLMDRYSVINLKEKGKSNREIAKELGIDRKTVAKYWNEYRAEVSKLDAKELCTTELREQQERIVEAPKYDTSSRGPIKYTEEIDTLVDEILDSEKEKARLLGNNKQQLTVEQIHQMVRDAGHDIGRTVIGEHVKEKRDKRREAFIRQEYDYGDRGEYDFGEVKLVIGGMTGTYYMAVIANPASKHRWSYLYENQKKEAFMDSHVRYFQMLGGVPREMVYDNMKNVVTRFIGRNEKELNEDLVKMAIYYGFEINVTNCFSGNEKGFVESSVKKLRREIFTKRYCFETLEEAEAYMNKCLVEINAASDIEEEKKFLLPARPPLELATLTRQKVDKYSFIRVDNNFYSVPDYLVGHYVDVKQYVKEILVYAGRHLVAKHKKIDGYGQMQVDIFHYLDTLERKPGAIKNSKALKCKAELKAIYDAYFTKRPKEFIELLREHQNANYDELVRILQSAGKTQLISKSKTTDEIEDNVIRRAKEQLSRLAMVYGIGGDGYVH